MGVMTPEAIARLIFAGLSGTAGATVAVPLNAATVHAEGVDLIHIGAAIQSAIGPAAGAPERGQPGGNIFSDEFAPEFYDPRPDGRAA
jgi:hypothetical protein